MTADTRILTADAVRLGLHAADKRDAIGQCGRLLLEVGAVEEPYLSAMYEREASVSTYIGEGVAIPHGTDAARSYVLRTALAVLQFPGGVDWDGQHVSLCIAIAADGNEHVRLLSSLATTLLDAEKAAELRQAPDVDTVLALLVPTGEDRPV